MKDVFKHLVTLAWFTAVFGVMFMIAFNYAKSAVEDTKLQVMESVNNATETITAPINSVTTGFAELGNNLQTGLADLDRDMTETIGQENINATHDFLDSINVFDEDNWSTWLAL